MAKALGIPLVTISDVLRRFRPNLDLSTGQLVDDQLVSDALLNGLKSYSKGYILDGFPRTLHQAQMMEETWPVHSQVQAALKLAVPDIVCETKLLGRRICKKCNGNYNVNAVDFGQWYLPSSLPQNCEHDCDPLVDWETREDDRPEIVKERLSLYHEHMDPILDYFESKNRLLKLSPYKGYDDVPEVIHKVQQWLDNVEGTGDPN